MAAGDLWFVTDMGFELRRYAGGVWVPTLYTGSAPFEIISGTTYIKKAAIREVDAGVILAGNITVALSLSTGSLSAGSGYGAFNVAANTLTFGNIEAMALAAGTSLFATQGTHSAGFQAFTSGSDSANVGAGNSVTGAYGAIYSSGEIAVWSAGYYTVGGQRVISSRKAAVSSAATDAPTDAATDANTALVTGDFAGADTVSLAALVAYFNEVDTRLNALGTKLNATAGKYNTAAGYQNALRDRMKVTGGHGLIAD